MKYAITCAAVLAAVTVVAASPVEIAARQYPNQTQDNNSTQNNGAQQGSSSQQGQAGSSTGMMIGNVAQGLTDADVFNLALTLEHLESAFYQQGLSNFTASDFQNAGLPAVITISFSSLPSLLPTLTRIY